MSALAFDFDCAEIAPAPQSRRRLYAVRGSVDAAPARTLDDALGGAWAALASGAAATCPVCASAMRPRFSAGAGVTGGRCDGCGSSLQ